MLTPDRVSINTATLGYRQPIAASIEAIARHGFGGIAPWRREIEGFDVTAIARHIRDAGLGVSGYCRSTYIPSATSEGRMRSLAENRQAIRDAAVLGAPCFVLVVGGLPDGSKDIDAARRQVTDGIAILLEEATQAGVNLALEPLHPMYASDRSCVNTIDQAINIWKILDCSERLTVAIDVYHTWWDPNLYASIAEAGRLNRIDAFHVCDWLVPTSDLLMDRGMMGDGIIELPRIRQALTSAGHQGFMEVEIFSTRWWQIAPADILSTVHARLRHC